MSESAPEPNRALFEATLAHALTYLDGLPERRVPATATTDELLGAFGGPVPEGPADPVEVIEAMVEAAEPGLAALGSPRFFGFVIGGTYG